VAGDARRDPRDPRARRRRRDRQRVLHARPARRAERSPYSASKHGVIGLTRTAAIEYAQRGIRVNAVCPGAIDTPMKDETFARFPGFREALTGFVPLGRMGAAAEVAAAIVWLLSDASSFVTGEALTVEGGLLSR
jgi:NAD(P)-dependent dehydrogenase (short-subunit alcohol dehydrogenase family)